MDVVQMVSEDASRQSSPGLFRKERVMFDVTNGLAAGGLDKLKEVLDYLQQEVRSQVQCFPEGGGACSPPGQGNGPREGDWTLRKGGSFRGPHLPILSNENMGQERALHSCKGNFREKLSCSLIPQWPCSSPRPLSTRVRGEDGMEGARGPSRPFCSVTVMLLQGLSTGGGGCRSSASHFAPQGVGAAFCWRNLQAHSPSGLTALWTLVGGATMMDRESCFWMAQTRGWQCGLTPTKHLPKGHAQLTKGRPITLNHAPNGAQARVPQGLTAGATWKMLTFLSVSS
ncbi:hypothetical protein P7K49_028779 [Saguinus oedipus]|uniref:Uncharacterized protein n=1 Tax=Saguinus oedipus TaxID=9490 RepID=A0ABQ9U5B5_SAGOE|nr:hypothetical protein P7K49_028779 [Saguinus oedipus]